MRAAAVQPAFAAHAAAVDGKLGLTAHDVDRALLLLGAQLQMRPAAAEPAAEPAAGTGGRGADVETLAAAVGPAGVEAGPGSGPQKRILVVTAYTADYTIGRLCAAVNRSYCERHG